MAPKVSLSLRKRPAKMKRTILSTPCCDGSDALEELEEFCCDGGCG